METIKIQVEIGFKEATLQVLDQMLRSIHKTADKAINEAPAQTAGANEAQAAKSDPAPAPAPAPVPAPAPAEPAAQATSTIDNMTLNKAVKDAKDRIIEAHKSAHGDSFDEGAAAQDAKALILNVFSQFDIAASRDCPADKRAALLKSLNDLTYHA